MKKEKINLINGEFSAIEAQEIINHMINKKEFQKTILDTIDEGKKMRIKSVIEIEFI